MESMDLNQKVIHENNEKFYETNNNRGMTQTGYYINQTHWENIDFGVFSQIWITIGLMDFVIGKINNLKGFIFMTVNHDAVRFCSDLFEMSRFLLF